MGLFKPAWMSDNADKAIAAFLKLSEPEQRKACGHLTNQAVISYLAQNASYDFVRLESAAKLEDKTIIRKMALSDKSEWVRCAAIKRLDDRLDDQDQGILIKIAMDEPIFNVRAETLKHLTDKNLQYVFQHCADFSFCLHVYAKLRGHGDNNSLLFYGHTLIDPRMDKTARQENLNRLVESIKMENDVYLANLLWGRKDCIEKPFHVTYTGIDGNSDMDVDFSAFPYPFPNAN